MRVISCLKVIDIFRSTHLQTRLTVYNLGGNYLASDRIEQLLSWLEEAYQNDTDKAEPLLRQALEKLQIQLSQAGVADLPARATICKGLIRIDTILGDQDAVQKWQTTTDSQNKNSVGTDHE